MGLRGDIDVPALSSGSPWSHFAVQVVARSVANLRGILALDVRYVSNVSEVEADT